MNFIKPVSIAVLLLLGVALLWGLAVEPRIIEVTRFQVTVPGLPPEWEGQKIAFFADLQVGMFLANEDTIRRIIERVLAEKPAAVLVGGDFVYHPTEDEEKLEVLAEIEREDVAEVRALISRVTSILHPLAEAGVPVYSVLGNHDYAMHTPEALKLPWVAQTLVAALEGIGIVVLQNEAVALEFPGGGTGDDRTPLFLVGIDAHYPREDNAGKAFSALLAAAPRIVLMHNPQSYALIPSAQAPLAMAAHTHGGQIRLPFLPSWSWLSIVKEHEIHADGWIEGFGSPGNRLYVNRGIGFSRVPIRINCRPEVTFFSLTAGEQESYSGKASAGITRP